MAGFLHAIKDYFDGGYHGRYFAILLRELAQHEPASFERILTRVGKSSPSSVWGEIADGLRKRTLSVVIEKSFPGLDGRKRRADIAVTDEFSFHRALFEVKEFDHKNSGNAAQLEDYLAEGSPFVYVSRFYPEPPLLERMEKQQKKNGRAIALLRYSDIHDALKNSPGPIAGMIGRYLEDIGVGIFKTIDLKKEGNSLAYLITRICAFPVYAGVGRLAGTDAVVATSDHFKQIFSNLEWLAEELRSVNKDLMPTKFTREFRPHLRFDLKKLKAALAKNDETGDGELPEGMDKYVQGGIVSFSAWGVLYRDKKKGGPLYVGLGYNFDVQKGRKDPLIKMIFYTSIAQWKGKQFLWEACSETNYLTQFSERKSLALLREHLAIARKEACRYAEGQYLSNLKEFRLPG